MSETELRLLGSVEVKGDEGVVAMHARPARVLLALITSQIIVENYLAS